MDETFERLFRFGSELGASLFVQEMEGRERILRRAWVGPFVRVPIAEFRRGAVEGIAMAHGGWPVGEWKGPIPSVERLLGEMEGYREIYGGVPEDEGRACVPGGEGWGG